MTVTRREASNSREDILYNLRNRNVHKPAHCDATTKSPGNSRISQAVGRSKHPRQNAKQASGHDYNLLSRNVISSVKGNRGVSLLDMPGEIRNMIYKLVLMPRHRGRYRQRGRRRVLRITSPLPHITRTSRQLRSETIGIYYSHTFEVAILLRDNLPSARIPGLATRELLSRWSLELRKRQTLEWLREVRVSVFYSPVYHHLVEDIRKDLVQLGVPFGDESLISVRGFGTEPLPSRRRIWWSIEDRDRPRGD